MAATAKVFTNFGDDWSNSNEMAAVFEIYNGGSRHLEKCTSG